MHRNDETVKGHFLCVAARANSHDGLFVFVCAFPCPVRGRTGRFARQPFPIRYCLSLPGIGSRYRIRLIFCPALVGGLLSLPLPGTILQAGHGRVKTLPYNAQLHGAILLTGTGGCGHPPLHGNSVLRMEFGEVNGSFDAPAACSGRRRWNWLSPFFCFAALAQNDRQKMCFPGSLRLLGMTGRNREKLSIVNCYCHLLSH